MINETSGTTIWDSYMKHLEQLKQHPEEISKEEELTKRMIEDKIVFYLNELFIV